jgi:hypothetical protein
LKGPATISAPLHGVNSGQANSRLSAEYDYRDYLVDNRMRVARGAIRGIVWG